MPSRADVQALRVADTPASTGVTLRMVGGVLHAVGVVCIALLTWRLFLPPVVSPAEARVAPDGSLNRGIAELLRAPQDTLDVTLDAVPTARTRALLRAVRGSGRAVRITAPVMPTAVAASAEQEWKAVGGTRVQIVASDASPVAVRDGAGLIDSVVIDTAGVRTRSGPIKGALGAQRAVAAPLRATAPAEARVLVLGAATWESRFVVAALEEAGWPVDAALSLSPKVTVTQGVSVQPTRSRHAVVIVLVGAAPSTISALPAFVRNGGGVVLIGDAARAAGMAALRAGAPGETIAGEAGAEASDEPRHGLDLVPIITLADGAVALESRDGSIAVAARRVGAGRVVQVGYENSWLWRMGGADDAPAAHRQWWNTMVSGLVPLRAPAPTLSLSPEEDTLDAAPMAALAADLGLPARRPASRRDTATPSLAPALDVRWLLSIALISLVASWTMRRWRGLV